jgi:hypothetical protein
MALPHCNLRRRNRSRIAIDRRVSLSRKREDLRLDIERKRAMFPKYKDITPGIFALYRLLAHDTTACHVVDTPSSRWSRTKNRN